MKKATFSILLLSALYVQAQEVTEKNIDDFLNIKYMFDLTLKELEFISNVCWGLLYLGVIYYLHFSNKPILKVLISVILPTILVISIFYITSVHLK